MATINQRTIFGEGQPGREMQDRLFPSARPSIPNLDYYGDWRPGSSGSGDYLDYFEVDAGNFCLAIGDVEGPAAHTALLTASLHSIVRALRFSDAGNLARLVATASELFGEVSPEGCHASLFVCRYDPVSGRLWYVNAGHETPVVLRKTSRGHRAIRLESCGPVIGLFHRTPYREGALRLHPGDLLAAYTDGLCEASNAAGEEWGWRRFLEALHGGARQRVRDLVEQVLDAADQFAAGAPQAGDRTLWIGRVDDAHQKLVLRSAECEDLVAA